MTSTDNDIIKALECCGSETTFMTCGDCPLLDVGKSDCHFLSAKKPLTLSTAKTKKSTALKTSYTAKLTISTNSGKMDEEVIDEAKNKPLP